MENLLNLDEEHTLRNYFFIQNVETDFIMLDLTSVIFTKKFQLWHKRNWSWINIRIVDFSFDICRWGIFAPLSLMLMVSLITIILIVINIIVNIMSMCNKHIFATIIIIIIIIIVIIIIRIICIRILTTLYMVLSLLLSALLAFSSTSSTFWWNEFWKNYPTRI